MMVLSHISIYVCQNLPDCTIKYVQFISILIMFQWENEMATHSSILAYGVSQESDMTEVT